MRRLIYTDGNGNYVLTHKEAKSLGYNKVELLDVAEEPAKRTPKRQAMLDKFGRVHPSLLDQI